MSLMREKVFLSMLNLAIIFLKDTAAIILWIRDLKPDIQGLNKN